MPNKRRAGVDVLQLVAVADDVGDSRADVAAEIEWLVHGAGRQPGRRFQSGSLPTRCAGKLTVRSGNGLSAALHRNSSGNGTSS